MFELPQSAVTKWVAVNNVRFPRAIKTNCPHCGSLAVLTADLHLDDSIRRTMAATLTCPACDEKSSIWAIGVKRAAGFGGDAIEGGCDLLVMHPAPKTQRIPTGELDKAPPAVQRAYLEALAAANAELWGLCLTGCRKTLEGILHSRGASGRSLYEMLQSMAEHPDVGKPIATLADVLRKGGNFGAHFDPDRSPDSLTAHFMLDFIEYLMEYFYALEARTELLSRLIQSINDGTYPPPD